jgi:hypothetical protein
MGKTLLRLHAGNWLPAGAPIFGWLTTWTESSANTAPFHLIAGSRASHEASGTAAGRRQIDSLQGLRLRSWVVASDIGCSDSYRAALQSSLQRAARPQRKEVSHA